MSFGFYKSLWFDGGEVSFPALMEILDGPCMIKIGGWPEMNKITLSMQLCVVILDTFAATRDINFKPRHYECKTTISKMEPNDAS